MTGGEYLILHLLLGDNIPPYSKNKDLVVSLSFSFGTFVLFLLFSLSLFLRSANPFNALITVGSIN